MEPLRRMRNPRNPNARDVRELAKCESPALARRALVVISLAERRRRAASLYPIGEGGSRHGPRSDQMIVGAQQPS